MSEGIVIGVVQSEKCDTGNGTFKQNYFENTLTFVSNDVSYELYQSMSP